MSDDDWNLDLISRVSHYCAVEGCTRLIWSTLLMCDQHWKMVPAILRHNIARSRDDSELLEPYRKAVSVAVTHVRDAELAGYLKKNGEP